jgi:hypothetical protein
MGRFKKIVLGELGGKVGNIVGRKRKGKFFIYAMPEQVKISNTPEAKKSRDIMIPLAKFASIVNSIPELKYFWVNEKIEAFDAFHRIEKVNFPYLIPERPTINNTITPIGFIVNPIKAGSISPTGINIKIVIDKEIFVQLDGAKELTGIGVICYFNPRSNEIDYFQLSKIRTDTFDIQIEEPIEIDMAFREEERSNYNSYLNSILYFAFVSKDINGTCLKITNSCSIEFTHVFISEKERFSICDSQS